MFDINYTSKNNSKISWINCRYYIGKSNGLSHPPSLRLYIPPNVLVIYVAVPIQLGREERIIKGLRAVYVAVAHCSSLFLWYPGWIYDHNRNPNNNERDHLVGVTKWCCSSLCTKCVVVRVTFHHRSELQCEDNCVLALHWVFAGHHCDSFVFPLCITNTIRHFRATSMFYT